MADLKKYCETEWLALYVEKETRELPRHQYFAYFWSDCGTQRAVDAATKAFSDVAGSIAETIKLLARPSRTTPDGEGLQFRGSDVNYDIEMMFWRPSLDDLFSDWGRSVFGRCAHAFFRGADKNCDPMAPRLRNALLLLSEADRQSNTAIRLSLCMSAIEALLCQKKGGIVDELSRNVATLLQPEPLDRLQAIKSVKKLYDCRSEALHGVKPISDGGGEAASARRLAAAVISGIVEWEEFQRRVGYDHQRKTSDKQQNPFLEELEAAQISGKEFVGVPATLAEFLPS